MLRGAWGEAALDGVALDLAPADGAVGSRGRGAELGSPYEQALALVDTGEPEGAFAALELLDGLGADVVAANAGIAARLFVSAKTAGHHVSAILAKLDVPTRREAAAAARALGVVPDRRVAQPTWTVAPGGDRHVAHDRRARGPAERAGRAEMLAARSCPGRRPAHRA